MSIHDIMDSPWPHDSDSKKVFDKALGEGFELDRIKPMHVLKVSIQKASTVQCLARCDCCHGKAFTVNFWLSH